ncbi:hypothetical protein B0H14DRAFT_3448029 [Mycena olivaceomarginata]|nr:hypothetical protein B0H14DRAFT_3448029 [Mycena olivaceomarginata]
MAPPGRAFDLKAVENLFRDTLAAVWDDTPDTEGLKPQAIEWLKPPATKSCASLNTMSSNARAIHLCRVLGGQTAFSHCT